MADVVNTGQAAVWNGPDGRHWADHHDRYDAMAEGFTAPLLESAALTGTSRVLDIGCGTGHTTRLAARAAPHGHAVGVDLSEPMLARARLLARRDAVANVTFVRGDAQVHPFPAGRFDVAISRAGVMFFADPVAAFDNIGRALEPGGRLVFLTHSHADARFRAVYRAVAEHVTPPAAPAEGQRGVASFADPDHVRGVLADAGFDRVTVTPVEIVSVLGRTARDATDFLLAGPLRPMVGHADSARRSAAWAAVHRVMRDSERDGAVRLPAHAWLYAATRPRVA